MTTEISRRGVARGAAWSVPAIAVGAAAPAVAASCNPATNIVNRAVSLTVVDSGNVVQNHNEAVTYTNSGSTNLPSGSVLTGVVTLNGTVTNVATNPAVLPSSTKVAYDISTQGNVNTFTYTLTLGADLTPGASISLTPDITYTESVDDGGDSDYSGGYTSSSFADKTQTTQSVVEGCQTTVSAINVTTSDDTSGGAVMGG